MQVLAATRLAPLGRRRGASVWRPAGGGPRARGRARQPWAGAPTVAASDGRGVGGAYTLDLVKPANPEREEGKRGSGGGGGAELQGAA